MPERGSHFFTATNDLVLFCDQRGIDPKSIRDTYRFLRARWSPDTWTGPLASPRKLEEALREALWTCQRIENLLRTEAGLYTPGLSTPEPVEGGKETRWEAKSPTAHTPTADEITLKQASLDYDVPMPVLSKVASQGQEDPGFLPTRRSAGTATSARPSLSGSPKTTTAGNCHGPGAVWALRWPRQ